MTYFRLEIGEDRIEKSMAILSHCPKDKHTLALYHTLRLNTPLSKEKELAQIIHLIPPHLSALKFINFQFVREEYLALFFVEIPPHVNRLSINTNGRYQIKLAQALKKLPDTIIDLDISHWLTYYSFGAVAMFFGSFPKYLKKLKFGQDTHKNLSAQQLRYVFTLLPITLEELHFTFAHVHNPHEVIDFLTALPPNLLKLSLVWSGIFNSPQILCHLPIHISRLDLSDNFVFMSTTEINRLRESLNIHLADIISQPNLFPHINQLIQLFTNIPSHVKELTLDAKSLEHLPDEVLIHLGQSLPHAVKLNLIHEDHLSARCVHLLKSNMGNWVKQSFDVLQEWLPSPLIGLVQSHQNQVTTQEFSEFIPFKNKAESEQKAKTDFLKCYDALYAKDKKGCFGFFRTSQLNRAWSLKEILDHGVNHNNRTRKICLALGWLDPKGQLLQPLPECLLVDHKTQSPST